MDGALRRLLVIASIALIILALVQLSDARKLPHFCRATYIVQKAHYCHRTLSVGLCVFSSVRL